MMKSIGIVAEGPDDELVALTPDHAAQLLNKYTVFVEAGAGVKAGFSDDFYIDAGAIIVHDRAELVMLSDVILTYRSYTAIDASSTLKTIISCHPVRDEYELLLPYLNRPISLYSLDLLLSITDQNAVDVSNYTSIARYRALMTVLKELLGKRVKLSSLLLSQSMKNFVDHFLEGEGKQCIDEVLSTTLVIKNGNLMRTDLIND